MPETPGDAVKLGDRRDSTSATGGPKKDIVDEMRDQIRSRNPHAFDAAQMLLDLQDNWGLQGCSFPSFLQDLDAKAQG
ncbi:hypothetical protein WJX72_005495 [[Myrmecia] bisecta]|uniref:Uncharacterized protein n=1 Tax=[Myrmecia] bisecta TaxID=41462 RepID=A0AAW1R6G4_9CHLO